MFWILKQCIKIVILISIVMKWAPGVKIMLFGGILLVVMSVVGELHSMSVYGKFSPAVSCIRSGSCF